MSSTHTKCPNVESQESVDPVIRMFTIAKSADSNAQRTPGWYALRENNFGGSEIDNLLKDYSAKTVIRRKLGRDSFKSNLYTRWGNIFEPMASFIAARKYGMPMIYETGSVPGFMDGLRYSPDGLGILDDELVLFEFKCPYSRIPNGIPKGYITQMQTGLHCLDIKRAFFIDSVIRLCRTEQLNDGTRSYDALHNVSKTYSRAYAKLGLPNADGTFDQTVTESHSETSIETADQKSTDFPEVEGVLSLSPAQDLNPEEQELVADLFYRNWNIHKKNLSRKNIIEDLFQLIEEKRINVKIICIDRIVRRENSFQTLLDKNDIEHSPKVVVKTAENLQRLMTKNRDSSTRTYIPWKLLYCHTAEVERNEDFREKISNAVTRSLDYYTELENSRKTILPKIQTWNSLELFPVAQKCSTASSTNWNQNHRNHRNHRTMITSTRLSPGRYLIKSPFRRGCSRVFSVC